MKETARRTTLKAFAFLIRIIDERRELFLPPVSPSFMNLMFQARQLSCNFVVTIVKMKCRNRDVDEENGHIDTEWEGEGGTSWEIRFDINTLPCVKKIASGKLLYSTGSSARCSVMT